MKRLLIGSVISGLVMASAALPAAAALKPGDAAPKFSAPASWAGKTFHYSLKNALKKGPVVVYFYPSAYTGGCDIEAHTFAANIDQFTAAGATVVGVSLDSIARLNSFSKDPNYCAGKFPTASDLSGSIAKSFDLTVRPAFAGAKDTRGVAIDHGFAERTTFIVNPNGTIAATIGGVAPADNVHRTLEAVQKLAAQRN